MSTDELQPKPEAFLDLIRRQQRGRLKIYLGFAAGVGKTYDMLQEGNRLRQQGIDVVIGFVEPHGRAETIAQIGQLEQVPRRRIEYRGIVLEEMDIDAVLARRPTIALVDELAHTNAPGSRNPKRYQDVEELLRAGISVITTLNIQHLESLHDIVERATGVRVKERIPDYVVTMADQIVNVDLSAEDLRDRLQAGKIYPPERVATAMENFFAPEKLTQLRELAMEEIAFRLDQHRREESQRSGDDGLGLGAGHGLPQLAEPSCPRPAAQGGPHRRPPGRAVVRGLRADAAGIAAADRRRHAAADRQHASTWPGNWAAPPSSSKAPTWSAPSPPSSRNTASRTSSWGEAVGPGIAVGSGRRSWTVCCGGFPASTWWWSTTARRGRVEGDRALRSSSP